MFDSKNGDDTHRRVEKAREVFDKHGDEIRAMIQFKVKDKFRAEDIFQDLFVSVVGKPIPPGVGDVRAYLYKAVTNDVIDRFRRARIHREGIERYAECRRDYAVPQEPQSVIIQAEEARRVFQLIKSQLPPREARAVMHRYGVGRSTSDTAVQLRLAKKSVSKYVSEAIRKVKYLVSEEERLAV